MKRISNWTMFVINGCCFAGLLSSCVEVPRIEQQAGVANKDIEVALEFDAEPIPTPEVVSGLTKLFADDVLNGYVKRALESNPSLKLSLANLIEAGFDTRQAIAPGLPTLTANGNATRADNGGSRSSSLNSGANGSFAVSLDARWELDLWGRIRAGVEAAQQSEQALAADYAAARQSIAAQTMQAYFALVAEDRLLDLSERRLKSFEKTVVLVERRFEAGTGGLSDVDLAKTDVETTKAEVEGRKDTRDQAARRLLALTGSYPKAKTVVRGVWPSLRRGVAAGIPSDVMLNRPDIHAAYLRILRLGKSSDLFKNLLDRDFAIWSLASSVVAPLVDGGERKAALGGASARTRQALANYESTVLDAFEEVENALGSERYLLAQEKAYKSALDAAQSAEVRTRDNYESGLVEILTLLDAQRRAFTTEEQLINTTALRYQNRVSLALALGKGL